MQYIDDIGCLTQRSQLDRLQEFADRITRERVKVLQPSDLLGTTVFVISSSGKESTWDLDHLSLAPVDMAKLTHGNADELLKLKRRLD